MLLLFRTKIRLEYWGLQIFLQENDEVLFMGKLLVFLPDISYFCY